MTTQPHISQDFLALCRALAPRAISAGVFQKVDVTPQGLVCQAKNCGAPAQYRLEIDAGRIWVILESPDRWLSQSIEQDLVHTGDKLEDLLEEELVDLGYRGSRFLFEHFRSEAKLYTFRSPLPVDLASLSLEESIRTAELGLLAYEACFRRLGDMEVKDEE